MKNGDVEDNVGNNDGEHSHDDDDDDNADEHYHDDKRWR